MTSNILIFSENRVILPPLQSQGSRPPEEVNPFTCFQLLRTRLEENSERRAQEHRLAKNIAQYTQSLVACNATVSQSKKLFDAIISAHAYEHPRGREVDFSFFMSKLSQFSSDSPYHRAAQLALSFIKHEIKHPHSCESLCKRFEIYLVKSHGNKHSDILRRFIHAIGWESTDFLFHHVFAVHTIPSSLTQQRAVFPSWWNTQIKNPQERIHFINTAIFRQCCETFQFAPSAWTPSQPIEVLISELAAHGPMFGTGTLSKKHFSSPLRRYGTPIGGHPVYAWEKGCFVHSGPSAISRPVIIIGAAVKDKTTFVYFQDPSEILDSESKSPIYLCSYERLTISVRENWGMTHSERNPMENGYLMYNTRFSQSTPSKAVLTLINRGRTSAEPPIDRQTQ